MFDLRFRCGWISRIGTKSGGRDYTNPERLQLLCDSTPELCAGATSDSDQNGVFNSCRGGSHNRTGDHVARAEKQCLILMRRVWHNVSDASIYCSMRWTLCQTHIVNAD